MFWPWVPASFVLTGHHLNIFDDVQLILIQIGASRSAAPIRREGGFRTCKFCRLLAAETAVRHR